MNTTTKTREERFIENLRIDFAPCDGIGRVDIPGSRIWLNPEFEAVKDSKACRTIAAMLLSQSLLDCPEAGSDFFGDLLAEVDFDFSRLSGRLLEAMN